MVKIFLPIKDIKNLAFKLDKKEVENIHSITLPRTVLELAPDVPSELVNYYVWCIDLVVDLLHNKIDSIKFCDSENLDINKLCDSNLRLFLMSKISEHEDPSCILERSLNIFTSFLEKRGKI